MQSLNEWFGVLWELLLDCREELCYQLICQTRPHSSRAEVVLVEGNVTTEEAVNYARVLIELGRDMCAEEVLRTAAFGGLVHKDIPIYASDNPVIVGGVVATA